MPLRLPRVIVRWRAGPTWKSGPPEDQPGWDEHAEFIDDLIERGLFVMGGPFGDNSGSISFFEGLSVEEVRAVIRNDPFVHNGVFELEEVREWVVYVDTRVG